MEWRDGRGHHSLPLAQQKCWPHLWMCYRGYWTVHQMMIRECNHRCDMEWGCKACSCQAGHATSSTSTQGSRDDYCPIEWRVWPVYTACLTAWCGSTGKTTRRCHGCQWASETCSWLKQTPWQCGYRRQWTNILVHLPIVNHDRGVLLLVGEGVRYCIAYFKDIYA